MILAYFCYFCYYYIKIVKLYLNNSKKFKRKKEWPNIFSDSLITELKFRNEISGIISNYTNLTQKGKNMMGVCPFHAERTPSFCVYPASNSFYCFGCGAGGDVITFLRMAEKYDYVEAVKYLAERVGIEIELSDEALETHNKKILMYQMNRDAAKFYYEKLISIDGKIAQKYLTQRMINLKVSKCFGLGYAPNSGFALVDFLIKKSYNEEDIILSNLGVKSRNGKLTDRFFSRIVFPIIDLRGNVIAFGARTLGNAMPKYINTSDTSVFKKSMNLFALNFANKSGNNNLILVEGYMDVVSMHQAGFKNTVATLGTSLTQEQAKIIARYTNEVIISYDVDEAGKKATERAINILRSNGLEVKILRVPKGKDPDEYLRGNKKENVVRFKKLLEASQSDTEYKLQLLENNYNIENTEGKIKFLSEATKVLSKISSPIEREIYILKLCEKTGISKNSIILQVKKLEKQRNGRINKGNLKQVQKNFSGISDKINPDKHSNLRACFAEESLISYIINNPDAANRIFKKVSEELFATEFNRRIYITIKNLVSNNKLLNITNIAENLSFQETGRISKIISGYNQELGTNTLVNEYTNVLKEEFEKNNIKKTENPEEIKKYIDNLKNKKK